MTNSVSSKLNRSGFEHIKSTSIFQTKNDEKYRLLGISLINTGTFIVVGLIG